MKTKNICEKNMTFQECELAIIRNAIDLAEIKLGKKLVNTPEVQSIIKIVEDFIKKKDLICYGGTAIDALLPNDDKIYNKDVELSDYDFFTYNALEDAKELADISHDSNTFKIKNKTVYLKNGQYGYYLMVMNGVKKPTNIPIPQNIDINILNAKTICDIMDKHKTKKSYYNNIKK